MADGWVKTGARQLEALKRREECGRGPKKSANKGIVIPFFLYDYDLGLFAYNCAMETRLALDFSFGSLWMALYGWLI